jgi:hypothetical protein
VNITKSYVIIKQQRKTKAVKQHSKTITNRVASKPAAALHHEESFIRRHTVQPWQQF